MLDGESRWPWTVRMVAVPTPPLVPSACHPDQQVRESNQDLLLANSRLSRCLLSLNARSAHLVDLMLGWCWGRCRTFLEYGDVSPPAALWRIERVTGFEAHCQLGPEFISCVVVAEPRHLPTRVGSAKVPRSGARRSPP